MTTPWLEILDERERVKLWRLSQLVRAEINADVAEGLAETDYDLHQILRVKGQGCPDDTLRRLFRADP